MKLTVEELVKAGAQQTSRKYRAVATLPDGMTGLEALKKYEPEEYESLMRQMENSAADTYRRCYARKYGHSYDLTVDEFAEFKQLTEGKSWRPIGPGCPFCHTFGHRHASDCPGK